MDDAFRSARITLDRAKYHMRVFNAQVDDFVNCKPWSYVIDKDSVSGKDIHKIVFTRLPSETLPCVLFDIANNLRAVLDQAGYAAARLSGHSNPTKCTFPFGDTLPEIEVHLAKRKGWKDLPPEILELFLSFQPYKGGDNTLWALNKLCNTKKHCALVPVAVSSALANFSADVPGGTLIGHSDHPDGLFQGWDATKNEMVLVTVPSGLDPKIRGHFMFKVTIEGIEGLRKQSTDRVLTSLGGTVENILAATEGECRKLGFFGRVQEN